jgi:uncharacterized protein
VCVCLCVCVEAVRLLISSGCDINVRSERNRSALHMAVWNHRPRIVSLLLNAKCELNIRDRYGDTALMMCARRGYAEILQVCSFYSPKFGR